MGNTKTIKGFSKLSKAEKLRWTVEQFGQDPVALDRELRAFWLADDERQEVLDGFSENTLSNFPMPYGIAPNFLINDRPYAVPMVIEERSVVAAASSAAKFWLDKGGFRTEVLGTTKLGQVHFRYLGGLDKLESVFGKLETALRESVADITANMERRGGGVRTIELLDFTERMPHYYQLRVSFETCDSMGANFINSVLEQFGQTLERFCAQQVHFADHEREVEIIMCILSNFTPDCLVRAEVSCPVEAFHAKGSDATGLELAETFARAIRIAEIDPYRAATHNKGIYNGVDAVVLATGNDFRAVEACGHAYAARDGRYTSLSHCTVEGGTFRFWLDLPLAVGTVGGLTKLHPLARTSLELLGRPSARELMQIIAATGLAQNFAAVRSLVTTGIQRGHMKMHLQNILRHLGADDTTAAAAHRHFAERAVSFGAVRKFVEG